MLCVVRVYRVELRFRAENTLKTHLPPPRPFFDLGLRDYLIR
jgi:hypothetical protein